MGEFIKNSKLHGCTLAVSLGLLLSSCLGSDIKRFGSTTASTANTPVNNANSFTIVTAYRDASQDAGTPIRIVNIQGVTGSTTAAFSNNCGSDGSSCTCEFFTSSSDATAEGTSSVSYSSANNTINCTMDAADIATPSDYNSGYVRLKTTTGTKASGLIPIKTSLTIEEVLGSDLSKTSVRKIYKYGCDFTFLEGEGLGTNPGTCVASQALGLITTTYNYYLYQGSGTDFNTNKKGGQNVNSVCSLQIVDRNCQGASGTLALQFGLYKESAGAFTVQVKAQPSYGVASEEIGYAALPDSNNDCPTGLTKVRPWSAIPTSIVPGTIYDPAPVAPNPSSQPAGIFTDFLNSSGSLNNQIFGDASTAPTNFIVNRQPNATPCTAGTDLNECSNATFGTVFQIFSVAYTSQQPLLCVLPSSLVSGL